MLLLITQYIVNSNKHNTCSGRNGVMAENGVVVVLINA